MNNKIRDQLISIEEISEEFGIHIGEAHSLYYRIEKKLKKDGKGCIDNMIPRHLLFEYLDINDPNDIGVIENVSTEKE